MDNKRHRDRVKAVLPVRVSVNDNSGNSYSELVHTLDITESGAKLGAVHHEFEVGSLITLQYKQHKATFRVIWTEPVPGRTEHQVGIEAVNHKDLWGLGPELRVQPQVRPVEQAAAAPAGA
jgi:hypothetical protein